jgi:hypothetical protein
MQKPSVVNVLRTAVLAFPFVCTAMAAPATTNVQFVNGLVLDGAAPDLSSGSNFDRRLGYFSDMYYDPSLKQWWGLSDRGPGGGVLNYETRVQRFTVDVAPNGAISNFQIAETVKFTSSGQAMNGLAPNPAGTLGRSFDPEGFVINPRNGNFLVSDEYGPTVNEFNRSGQLIRSFTTPSNLVPRAGADVNYNATPPTLTAGREGNRGMEGLTISPDGKFAYGMLQNGTIQDGWTSSARGKYTRIIKYDTETGQAVAQYAYELESSGQGRGISAIVALGNDRFLVLERNNRGVGVGATLAAADKNVFEIDLSTAVDVSNTTLPATGAFAGAVTKVAKVMDLDANTLAALGNRSPEKWEGLAVGPMLGNGSYLLLAGTDNDYSVTQSGSGTQLDVYFRFDDIDPYAGSIQCPLGDTTNCSFTTGGAATSLLAGYALLPGVLHAYTANIAGYVAPAAVPVPATLALVAMGLALMGAGQRARPRR